MYKALNYWVFGGFDGQKTPYEFVDFAAEQGLDGIELTVGDILPIDMTEAECKKLAAYAKDKNIGLRTLATGGGWKCAILSPDAAEREAAIQFTEKYLQIAAWLGTETILLVPGATCVPWDPSRPIIPYKTAWETCLASLKRLAPVAERLNVNLAVENVWNQFLLSPMEWKYFLDQVNSSKVGMYFDVGNVCLFARPQDYPEILGGYIKAIHLKNFEPSDCAGGLHGFGDDLMKGAVDFKKVFAELKKINYNGPFTVEMVPFSRGENLVLPDLPLAAKAAQQALALENL